jgi:hypothetical protein
MPHLVSVFQEVQKPRFFHGFMGKPRDKGPSLILKRFAISSQLITFPPGSSGLSEKRFAYKGFTMKP